MPLLIRSDEGVGIKHHGFGLFLVTLIMTVLSTALVFIRIQQRRSNTQKLGRDDAAIFASMVFNLVLGITTIIGVIYGYGMHQSQLGDYDRYVARMTFYLEQIFYKGTLNCTKLSMLLMYLRIFTEKRARTATHILKYTIGIYAVFSIFLTVIQCAPFAKIFDKSVPGICIDVTRFWYANAIFNLVTDLMILALPIPSVYEMQMKRMHKFGLFILFGLGLFVCGITVIRMTPLEMTSKDPDVTFGSYASTYWTIVEVNTGILCACLPTWKFFLGKLFPCVFPDDDTSNNSRPRRARRAAVRAYANNLTAPLSRGRHGASRVSQASSQTPIIAPPQVRRSRKDTLRGMPYDQTVSAGEPSFGRGTPELDFEFPDGRAGRLHNQDVEMHALKPVSGPYPIVEEDEDLALFMEALK